MLALSIRIWRSLQAVMGARKTRREPPASAGGFFASYLTLGAFGRCRQSHGAMATGPAHRPRCARRASASPAR